MEPADVDQRRADELPRAEFLAALAHELRTPLAALRVSLDLLRDPRSGGTDAEERRRLMETIGRGVQRLEQHVTDMLEIGYLRRNTLALRRERVEPSSAVVTALDVTRQHAIQRRVTIDLTLEQDLPELSADPDRLTQVLANLLTNAIKFSPLGGSVGLAVSAAPAAVDESGQTADAGEGGSPAEGNAPPREMVFSVSDQGPGIAEEYRERIFWPFYEVPRRRSEGAAGTGLGLAIAQSLVELHGGRLWVESGVEEGTTFRLAIPIGEDDEDPGS